MIHQSNVFIYHPRPARYFRVIFLKIYKNLLKTIELYLRNICFQSILAFVYSIFNMCFEIFTVYFEYIDSISHIHFLNLFAVLINFLELTMKLFLIAAFVVFNIKLQISLSVQFKVPTVRLSETDDCFKTSFQYCRDFLFFLTEIGWSYCYSQKVIFIDKDLIMVLCFGIPFILLLIKIRNIIFDAINCLGNSILNRVPKLCPFRTIYKFTIFIIDSYMKQGSSLYTIPN